MDLTPYQQRAYVIIWMKARELQMQEELRLLHSCITHLEAVQRESKCVSKGRNGFVCG
jgi:hypothetical protein